MLRQRNLKVGEYAHVPEKQYTEEEWKRAMEHSANIVPDRYDLAEQAIPEVEDVGYAEQRGTCCLIHGYCPFAQAITL